MNSSMCLIGLRIDAGGDLLIAANRDEFSDRPTQALHWWKDRDILAGRDLKAGGTWLGITRNGRFAAVTNVRDPSIHASAVPHASRGLIVKHYLESNGSAHDHAIQLLNALTEPSPFNLLLGEIGENHVHCFWLGGRIRELCTLTEGSYVLSNAELDTPWPKTQALKAALLSRDDAQVMRAMESTSMAADQDLPVTGVAFAWEKRLSAALIAGQDYHTRSTTWISVNRGQAQVHEITRNSDASQKSAVRELFVLQSQPRLV